MFRIATKVNLTSDSAMLHCKVWSSFLTKASVRHLNDVHEPARVPVLEYSLSVELMTGLEHMSASCPSEFNPMIVIAFASSAPL